MDIDSAPDLPFLSIQIPQNHLYLQRISVDARRLCQLVDGLIYLVVDQKIEAEHVVRRFTQAAAVDPAAATKLVALPCLADRQSEQQGHQHGQEVQLGGQNISVRHRSWRCTTPSTRPLRSTTTMDVILRCSKTLSTSTASVPGVIVTGLRVMMSAAVRSSTLTEALMCRLRSPSVITPASRSASTTQVMPSP